MVRPQSLMRRDTGGVMSRNTLIFVCLVAGVAVCLGSPTNTKETTAEEATNPQPKITYSKETIASKGDEVKIDCAVEGVDLTGVDGFGVSWSWIDVEKPVNSFPITANDKVLLFSDRFSVEHPEGSYQYSLTIKKLEEEDAGIYRCTVNFGEDQKINADVPVKIQSAPYFTDDFTKTLTVTEGDAISIDCQPGGAPKPDVYWERLNQELPYYGGKFFKANQFDIPLIERDHEGHYVCYADNGIGDPATSHIILEVQFPPQVSVDKSQQFVSNSETVSMTCTIEAHPTADASWYKDDTVILGGANRKLTKEDIMKEGSDRPIGVKSTLTINKVTEDDFGTFYCKSANTIGKTERTVELRRKSPPKIVTQSRKEVLYDLEKSNLRDALPVVIECEADGDPTPDYRWNKNGAQLVWQADPRFELEAGTGNLLITDPTLKDNGLYQCFAYNDLGTAVAEPVYLINSTSIKFSNAEDNQDTYEVVAEIGRPFKLSCPNATGYPTPELNWVKAITHEDQIEIQFVNEERIVPDPFGNLWFTHVTPEDATEGNNFQYMCLGSTSFQPTDYSIASVIKFKVVPPADGEHNGEKDSLNVEAFEMYTSPSEVTFTALQNNTLWCIHGGEPAPQVNWRRTDGGKLDETRLVTRNFGRTLVFVNTQLEDAGVYECVASNGVGEPKSAIMNVQVEQAPTFIGDMASQTVAEGSAVTFTCEVEATGDLIYQWMFNGRPISNTDNHPRRDVANSILRIKDVSMVDIGNYACNATNDDGHAYGQATLNVIPGEYHVSGTSSEEFVKLRSEVDDLRTIIQQMQALIIEQLEVSKDNQEKLNGLVTLLKSPDAVKESMHEQEEEVKVTEEEMSDANEESTTQLYNV